jgi:hypothetical protein
VTVSDDENELLTQAFRQLSRGAALVARHQRKNIGEVDIKVGLDPREAAIVVRRILAAQGRLLRSDGYERAILGADRWDLNPTVVTVRLDAAGPGTSISVRGVACEGLIRQRAGEAAARRIADLIRSAAARTPTQGKSPDAVS